MKQRDRNATSNSDNQLDQGHAENSDSVNPLNNGQRYTHKARNPINKGRQAEMVQSPGPATIPRPKKKRKKNTEKQEAKEEKEGGGRHADGKDGKVKYGWGKKGREGRYNKEVFVGWGFGILELAKRWDTAKWTRTRTLPPPPLLYVSDAAMLAPEGVFSGKGDVKDESELTQADRKRRRAKKKRLEKQLLKIVLSNDLIEWSTPSSHPFAAEEAKRMTKKSKLRTMSNPDEGLLMRSQGKGLKT